MHVGLGFDVALDGADAMRTVTDNSFGDKAPAQRAAEQERGVLALVERAGREIPERRLAGARLVDTDLVVAGARWIAQHDRKGVIGTPRHQLTLFNRPRAQRFGVVVGGFHFKWSSLIVHLLA